jgi:hypothetical protein
MSVLLMARVWQLDLPHNLSWVLMALADHADDQGRNCYPSIGYLSWKCKASERTIQRVLRELEDRRLIQVTWNPDGMSSNDFRLTLDNGTLKPPYERKRRGRPKNPRQNDTSFSEESITGDMDTPNNGKLVTPVSKTGDTAVAPEPSGNHHSNHKIGLSLEELEHHDAEWQRTQDVLRRRKGR